MLPDRPPLRLVVMISGHGSNLQAMIDAIAGGDLHAEIAAVVADRPTAYGLERARRAGIPAQVIAPAEFADRGAWHAALLAAVDKLQPGAIALAGFMRLLDRPFVDRFTGRLLNVHPSLLPALRGLHTHRRALDAKLRQHGASIHFVTHDLDSGPLILQARVPVLADDTESTLAARVQAAEHIIYPRAIGWFATGRLRLYDGRVYLDGKRQAKAPLMDFA